MNNMYFNVIQGRTIKLRLFSKYLAVFLVVITASCLNYFNSLSMALLITFILAYLSKGSRR